MVVVLSETWLHRLLHERQVRSLTSADHNAPRSGCTPTCVHHSLNALDVRSRNAQAPSPLPGCICGGAGESADATPAETDEVVALAKLWWAEGGVVGFCNCPEWFSRKLGNSTIFVSPLASRSTIPGCLLQRQKRAVSADDLLCPAGAAVQRCDS